MNQNGRNNSEIRNDIRWNKESGTYCNEFSKSLECFKAVSYFMMLLNLLLCYLVVLLLSCRCIITLFLQLLCDLYFFYYL